MDINSGFVIQIVSPTTKTVTLPVAYSTSTSYVPVWQKRTSSWSSENMSWRNMEIKDWTITGFSIYDYQRRYLVFGY